MNKKLLHSLFCLMLLATGVSTAFGNEAAMTAAIQNGDLKTVLQLIGSGFNLETPDDQGNPPLLQACLAGREGIAVALIENGAKVNVQPQRHGLTPLMVASAKGQELAVQSLMTSGAQINTRGLRGQTPLYLCVFFKKRPDYANAVKCRRRSQPE